MGGFQGGALGRPASATGSPCSMRPVRSSVRREGGRGNRSVLLALQVGPWSRSREGGREDPGRAQGGWQGGPREVPGRTQGDFFLTKIKNQFLERSFFLIRLFSGFNL